MLEQTAHTGTEHVGAGQQAESLQKLLHKQCLEAVNQLRELVTREHSSWIQIMYCKPQYRNKNHYLHFHRQIWAANSSSPVPALQPGHMCCRKIKKSPASFCLKVVSHQHLFQPYSHATALTLSHYTADSGTFTLFTLLFNTMVCITSVETHSSSLN